jgi:hypothetical protein
MIGEHTVRIRWTVDRLPEIRVIVHREGESVASALEEAEMLAEAEAAGAPVQLEYLEVLDAEEAAEETAEVSEDEPEVQSEEEVEAEDEVQVEEEVETDTVPESETEPEDNETE